MGREMHRPQAAFECTDGSGFYRETIRCHLALGEKSVKQHFTPDDLHPEWSGSGAHLLEDDLNLLTLGFRQLEFVSQRQKVLRSRVTVKLSRLRHPTLSV